MGEFFSDLTTIEKIYWMVTIVSSVFFLIQMISVFVLGDMDADIDGDVDFDVETDTGIPFQFFTFRNLVGFMTVFGWSGLGSIANGNSNLTTILISVIGGLLMMVLMTFLFYSISKLTASGNLNMKNAVGKTASIYIPIKAKRESIGKVQVKIQGSLRELDAVTDDEEDLKTGMVVTVTKVFDGNLLLVTKSK
ncbi:MULTISPECIES: hypothetical protein [unclassified Lentimicrobium]|uniref:hypothetical protein n=1 Tax=unclassified Lentimicrobium TaxID=2677434 RepID=UPI001553D7A5|nr:MULTISPECIES: hypothetical protein [unclassified Lentimicrobium]NPD46523.1 hypothetical protein [Lentimicrobium sp. S6]NPD85172.1 hypothetical protein [Lentimicrobium sp. L6]